MKTIVKVLLCLMCLVTLASCLPAVVPTEHNYLLVVAHDGGIYDVLLDDDPLYSRFDAQVLGDPYLLHLVTVFEHTTEAFIATNKRTSLVDTVSNRPIIVLDCERVGVLRDIKADYDGERCRLELGIGLGPGTSEDMTVASRHLARAIALSLLELAGMPRDGAFADSEETLALGKATDPNWALREGFVAALEARYGAADPANLSSLRGLPEPNPEQQRRLDRYALVDRPTYEGDLDADSVPAAVAILMLRLLGGTSDYYPQRHMLWMTNYEPEQYAEAKVLLAFNRISNKGSASVRDFAASYGETFPAERAFVQELMTAVME